MKTEKQKKIIKTRVTELCKTGKDLEETSRVGFTQIERDDLKAKIESNSKMIKFGIAMLEAMDNKYYFLWDRNYNEKEMLEKYELPLQDCES